MLQTFILYNVITLLPILKVMTILRQSQGAFHILLFTVPCDPGQFSFCFVFSSQAQSVLQLFLTQENTFINNLMQDSNKITRFIFIQLNKPFVHCNFVILNF